MIYPELYGGQGATYGATTAPVRMFPLDILTTTYKHQKRSKGIRRMMFGAVGRLHKYAAQSVTYSTVQYSTVQYSTVQYSIVQVQYSTVQYSTVQYSTVQYSTARYNSTSNTAVHKHINPPNE